MRGWESKVALRGFYCQAFVLQWELPGVRGALLSVRGGNHAALYADPSGVREATVSATERYLAHAPWAVGFEPSLSLSESGCRLHALS